MPAQVGSAGTPPGVHRDPTPGVRRDPTSEFLHTVPDPDPDPDIRSALNPSVSTYQPPVETDGRIVAPLPAPNPGTRTIAAELGATPEQVSEATRRTAAAAAGRSIARPDAYFRRTLAGIIAAAELAGQVAAAREERQAAGDAQRLDVALSLVADEARRFLPLGYSPQEAADVAVRNVAQLDGMRGLAIPDDARQALVAALSAITVSQREGA